MVESEHSPFQQLLANYAPLGRSGLLPVLQYAQKEFGYLSEDVAAEIGRALGVPLADVYGVIEFYSLLSTQPTGRRIFQVCADPVCAMAGSDEVIANINSQMGIQSGSFSADGSIQVQLVHCLGLCNHAPALLAGDEPMSKISLKQSEDLLDISKDQLIDYVGGSQDILTGNCRRPGRTTLEEYQNGGGYAGLQKALQMKPETVIAEVKSAGLLGRGGAAFPAGIKWEAVANANGGTKYVVCNADESEPGTFKDRILLEKDPHATIEGMLIAAYATGAREGYIYVRGEYSQAYIALEQALSEAKQSGLLGENILASGLNFEIKLRQGAGAYICGEETALFESIEGKRGFPRMKPPFPTTHGLFGQPTVVNNIETLANIPFIINAGAPVYRQIGTSQSTGPKLFCISGDVARPGLYELPFGITLGEVLYEWAGGFRPGERLGAILLGGAAGTFATEDDLNVRLSIEDTRAAGLAIGSGAIMVFAEHRDLRSVLQQVAHFFAHESCGKCYPCQIGTARQHEILSRVAAGKALPGDDLRLADVGWTMTDASLCGLGQTAAMAVLSALQLWPELFISKDGS